MAGACPADDDRTGAGNGPGMAAVQHRTVGQQAVSLHRVFLADAGVARADFGPMDSGRVMARRSTGGVRHHPDFRRRLRHRPARQLLHFAISVADHRSQYSVFAAGNFSDGRGIAGVPVGAGNTGVFGKNSGGGCDARFKRRYRRVVR